MVRGFVVRQVVVYFVIVHSVMPGNDILLRVGVLVDERIMRGCGRARGKIIRFVDDKVLDLALFPGPRAAPLRQEVRIDRYVLDIAEPRVQLRRPADRPMRQHTGGKRRQQQHRQQQRPAVRPFFPFFPTVKPCNLQSVRSPYPSFQWFYCTTFRQLFQRHGCKLFIPIKNLAFPCGIPVRKTCIPAFRAI